MRMNGFPAVIAECFPEMWSWCWKEHVCQGVKCRALGPVLWTGHHTYLFLNLHWLFVSVAAHTYTASGARLKNLSVETRGSRWRSNASRSKNCNRMPTSHRFVPVFTALTSTNLIQICRWPLWIAMCGGGDQMHAANQRNSLCSQFLIVSFCTVLTFRFVVRKPIFLSMSWLRYKTILWDTNSIWMYVI